MEYALDADALIAVAEQQEQMLQFEHFSRTDAWELGNLFVAKIRANNYPMTVSIRLCSGLVVFHYAPEGTSLNNESWLNRKFNVVRDLEASGILNTLRIIKRKTTMEERGLDPKIYAWGGGGFPVRVRGTGLSGAVLVSGLPHVQDHAILVECIAEYLKIADVPRISPDENI
jgi:uncharacterized protein (UPF0303 family)